MFFSKNINLTGAGEFTEYSDTPFGLAAGIIHQIDILFPINADRKIYVKLMDGAYQLCPTNRDGAIRANNTIISTREYYELIPGRNIITVRAKNVQDSGDLMITVNIGVLPTRILQPFSFKELLAAALGMEEPVEK